MRQIFLIVLINFFFFSYGKNCSFAQEQVPIKNFLQNFLQGEQIGKISLPNNISEKHPDYPIYLILKSYLAEERENYVEVIKILEGLRQQILYKGIEKKSKENKEERDLLVGTFGSFKLWREFSYLLLGRAYYQQKRYKEAIEAFQGVPKDSPFYAMSLIGLNWCFFAQNTFLKVSENIAFLEEGLNKMPFFLQQEFKLQKSLFLVRENKFFEGMELADEVLKQGKKLPKILLQMGFKVFAEAGYHDWLTQTKTLTFQDNLKKLGRVIDISKLMPLDESDPEGLFFVAEAFWNLASLYRIEDPIKYENKWRDALSEGKKYLLKLVNNSINDQKAHLREDSYFLSIVICWELEDYKNAVKQLQNHEKLYPLGRYREDVHQLLGDYYFDRHQYKNALTQYRKLVEVAGTEKAAYGSYKAAWAFYNMGKKWPALRQLERLLLHFWDSYKGMKQQSGPQVTRHTSILKESHRDMLLFLAELMSAIKSLKELDLFKYTANDRIFAEEDLALTYKRIGSFKDSSLIFKKLISENMNNVTYGSHSFSWLKELLDNHLRDAQRMLIPKDFRQFYFAIKHDGSELSLKNKDELREQFSELILTMHREAKKSESQDIWNAVDESYLAFYDSFPESKNAKIWYHGAQRFEMKQNLEEAQKWYKRAALIKGFEYAEDAAFSFLTILKDESDQLSIKDITDYNRHALLAKRAYWYIEHFPQTKQRHFADHLYLEHLLIGKQYATLKGYFQKIITEEGLTDDNKSKINKIQTLILKKKDWKVLASVSEGIILSLKKEELNDPFAIELKRIWQESSFQKAFSEKDVKNSRLWYKKTIKLAFNNEITLKAYHNLFLTHDADEFSELLDEIADFPEETFTEEKDKELLFQIWNHLSILYKKRGDYVAFADYQLKSLNYKNIPEVKYDILLLYGAYQEKDKLLNLYEDIQKNNPLILEKGSRPIEIAKIFFWNNLLEKSFLLLKKEYDKEQINPAQNLLLRDLYLYAKKEGEDDDIGIKDFLLKNKDWPGKFPILSEIWDPLLHDNFDFSPYEEFEIEVDLFEGEDKTSERLKNYAIHSTEIIESLNKKIKEITPFLKDPAPLFKTHMYCLIPRHRAKMMLALKTYLENPIQHKNWVDFEKRIKNEFTRMSEIAKSEIKKCQEIKKTTSLIKGKCFLKNCFDFQKPQDFDDKKSDKEIIEKLINEGAVAFAHQYSFKTKLPGERFYYQGLIRLFHQDLFNAYEFFRECLRTKTASVQNSCEHYLKLIEENQNNL